MTRKIRCLFAALAVLVAAAGPATAQVPKKIPTIGFLHPASFGQNKRVPHFLQGLRDHGYVEGRNIRIAWRFADGEQDRLPALAADLVKQKVDVIVCVGASAQAARDATSTIPIVIAVTGDYVAAGWAKSISRPGGNVTGLSTQAAGLMGKQLELLKETVPGLSRVAIVAFTGNRGHAEEIRQAKEAAPVLGLGLVTIIVGGAADLPAAFRRMEAERVDGVVVLRDGTLNSLRGTITTLAKEAGLPSLFGHRIEATAGGLMAYGADTKALYRGAGFYIDKILKGANPAELPISQATKFDFVLNLKTAKALGITFPPSILLRATEVVE